MMLSTSAASNALLAIGPGAGEILVNIQLEFRKGSDSLSWVELMGTMPALEANPTVGLMPYSAARFEGQMMLPSSRMRSSMSDQIRTAEPKDAPVSVPIVTAAQPALAATPLPADEPQGSPPASYPPST